MAYKGYEIAQMLTEGNIKEGSLLTTIINDKSNEENELYIVYDNALWDIKEVDGKIVKNYEIGNSMLTCKEIQFKILRQCENCNEIIESDEIYHKYHGHCCGQCEIKSIENYNNKLKDLNKQQVKDLLKEAKKLDEYFNLDKHLPMKTITLKDREDFFRGITDEEIENINKALKNYGFRFF